MSGGCVSWRLLASDGREFEVYAETKERAREIVFSRTC